MIDEFQQIQGRPEGSRRDFWGCLGAEITDLTIKADAEWVKKRMDEVWLEKGGLLAIGDRCDLDVIFLCEITIRLPCVYIYIK